MIYTRGMKETKHTILVVEDEVSTALALCDKLEHEGFRVTKASNGKEGLANALKNHPDLILADLKLPEMDGMEMIRQLRTDSWGKDAKVIILTNVSDVSKVEEAMVHGTFFYMVKGDSSMSEIVDKVKMQLDDKK